MAVDVLYGRTPAEGAAALAADIDRQILEKYAGPKDAHARLGGSNAARWLACAGSIRLSEGMPNEHGFPAGEGNVAHHLAHLILDNDGMDPEEYIGTIWPEVEPEIPVTEDMIDPVMLYVEHVRGLLDVVSPFGIESKVSLAKLSPPEPMFGTADFWGYEPGTRTLHIADLKYGQGVMVEVGGNKQTRYYAVGVVMDKLDIEKYPIDKIVMTIVQPRKDHPEGAIRTEEITGDELLEFAEKELMPGAWATQAPDAPLVTGAHCRFCPAQAVCPALARASAELAQDEFGFYSEPTVCEIPDAPVQLTRAAPPAEIVRVPAPEALTNSQIGVILPKLEVIGSYIKAVKAHAEAEIRAGRAVPGFKVVERRSRRVWQNADAAASALMDMNEANNDIFNMEPKSPPQIEKLVGKKKFKEHLAQHTVKKSSGVVLVPDTDSRTNLFLAPGEEFGVLPAPESTDNKGDNEENE